MSRRLVVPMIAVLLLLVGATEGPHLWPTVVEHARQADWSRISALLNRAGDAIVYTAARGGEFFGWSPMAFAIGVSVLLVCTIALLTALLWPSRRKSRVRRGSPQWTRRHEVGRLAQAGAAVAVIARETRLSQDAVRTLMAAP